eukprot:tig00001065_g6741.t1
MPPKKGKKKKKSKKEIEAELERQRLEAEAAQRLEEARLEKERKEQERLEKERREQEAIRRAQEVQRLGEEAPLAAKEREIYYDRIKRAEKDIEVVESWRKYLECMERPQADDEADVRTYYNLWNEAGERRLATCMKEFQYAEEICKDLERMMAHAAERHDERELERSRAHLTRIRDLITTRMDQCTAHLIQYADEHANAKNECQLWGQTDDFKFGLWVNLAKNPRVKQIEYPELGITSELPRGLALAPIAIRAFATSYDPFSQDHPNGLSVLGPVISLELLALPPPPKKARGWTIRHVTALATNVQRLPYPIPPQGGAAAAPAGAGGEGGAGGVAPALSVAPSAATAPPMKVTYVLPPAVLLREEKPRVGHWDPEEKQWREEASEVVFTAETRAVSFTTSALTHIALLQSRQLDLPYLSWTLEPNGRNRALLTLELHTCQVQIQVEEGAVAVVQPAVDELKDIIGVQTSPSQLLLRLSKSGFNVTPVDWDARFLEDITPKQAALERDAHYAVARVAQVYNVASSKWNQGLGDKRLLVRLQQNTKWIYPTRQQFPWTTVLFEPEPETASSKCVVTQSSDEATEGCNYAPAEGCETHATLLGALEGRMAPEMTSILEDASALFQQQIQHLFNLLRPFSFN